MVILGCCCRCLSHLNALLVLVLVNTFPGKPPVSISPLGVPPVCTSRQALEEAACVPSNFLSPRGVHCRLGLGRCPGGGGPLYPLSFEDRVWECLILQVSTPVACPHVMSFCVYIVVSEVFSPELHHPFIHLSHTECCPPWPYSFVNRFTHTHSRQKKKKKKKNNEEIKRKPKKNERKFPHPTAYRYVCRGADQHKEIILYKVNIASSKLLQRIETTSTTSQHLANSYNNNKNNKWNFQRYIEKSRGDCKIGNGGG